MEKNKCFFMKLSEILNKSVDENQMELSLEETEWDSLTSLAIVAAIDEIYQEVVPIHLLQRCKTVGEILRLIQAAQQKEV